MKKIIALVISLTLVCSSMTACGKTQTVDKALKSEPVTIYLTRHGETLFNATERIQGWTDSPLTEKGINQAKSLAKGLKDIELKNIYSSTSERAMDTANFILEGREGLELQLDEGFKEMNFGSLEAEPSERLWEKGMDYCFEEGWKEYGGEDFYILGDRAMKSLDKIVQDKENSGGNVLISTHGMTILALIYAIDPAKGDEIEGSIENCSITKLVWDNGKYSIELMNDTSYLK